MIGYGFAGVGLFAWYRRPDNPVGALMVRDGVRLVHRASSSAPTPPLLFSIGLLLENLFVVTAIHLVLAFPTGRLESKVDRWIVGIGYAVVTIGFLPFVLFSRVRPVRLHRRARTTCSRSPPSRTSP